MYKCSMPKTPSTQIPKQEWQVSMQYAPPSVLSCPALLQFLIYPKALDILLVGMLRLMRSLVINMNISPLNIWQILQLDLQLLCHIMCGSQR
jgi:hypothetical protein